MLSDLDRAQFLSQLSSLAPGADARALIAFGRTHQSDLIEEIGAIPGYDQIRAGALRLLPALIAEASERAPVLARAALALEAFQAEHIDGVDTVRRHPSWVALAAREWAEQVDTEAARLQAAQVWDQVAAVFHKTAPLHACGAGEIAWAVAELAAEVGWDDHADALLAYAREASFEDEDNRDRVALVCAMRLAEREDPEAGEAIEALLARGIEDDEVAVQALWVAAHLDHEAGRDTRAIERLQQAIERIDDEAEDAEEDRARLAEVIDAWSERSV